MTFDPFSLALHLKLCGLSLLALCAMHAFLGGHLGWKDDLAQLKLINRQIFYSHTFFIALMLALLGTLSLFGTGALLQRTPLGADLLGGVALFWGLRLVFQFFVYSPAVWRGKAFETFSHVAFSLLWAYYTLVFGWAFYRQMHG